MKINRYYITHGCRKAHHVAPSRSVTLVSSSALTDSGLLASEWLASFLPCIAHSCPWGSGADSPNSKRCSWWYQSRACTSWATQQATSIQSVAPAMTIAWHRCRARGQNMVLSRSTSAVRRERVCSSKSAAHSQARSARLASDRLRSDSRA